MSCISNRSSVLTHHMSVYSDGKVIHEPSSHGAALRIASENRLPLGSSIYVTDVMGEEVRYVVTRSALSSHLEGGGKASVTMVPLGDNVVPDVHTIYAADEKQAAFLYASEMGGNLASDMVRVTPLSEEGGGDRKDTVYRFVQ